MFKFVISALFFMSQVSSSYAMPPQEIGARGLAAAPYIFKSAHTFEGLSNIIKAVGTSADADSLKEYVKKSGLSTSEELPEVSQSQDNFRIGQYSFTVMKDGAVKYHDQIIRRQNGESLNDLASRIEKLMAIKTTKRSLLGESLLPSAHASPAGKAAKAGIMAAVTTCAAAFLVFTTFGLETAAAIVAFQSVKAIGAIASVAFTYKVWSDEKAKLDAQAAKKPVACNGNKLTMNTNKVSVEYTFNDKGVLVLPVTVTSVDGKASNKADGVDAEMSTAMASVYQTACIEKNETVINEKILAIQENIAKGKSTSSKSKAH